MFWPGSEAKIEGMQPDIWYPYEEGMPTEERVDKIIEWAKGDEVDFIAAYFSKLDFVGHQYGPDSQEVCIKYNFEYRLI